MNWPLHFLIWPKSNDHTPEYSIVGTLWSLANNGHSPFCRKFILQQLRFAFASPLPPRVCFLAFSYGAVYSQALYFSKLLTTLFMKGFYVLIMVMEHLTNFLQLHWAHMWLYNPDVYGSPRSNYRESKLQHTNSIPLLFCSSHFSTENELCDLLSPLEKNMKVFPTGPYYYIHKGFISGVKG